MLKRLAALFRPDPNPVDHLLARIDDLAARLAVLEEQQHPSKLLEWVDLQDRLKRYLQRVTTVEQRIRQREGKTDDPAPDDITRALLRAKYPHSNGG